jgi:hypothetical protein
MSDMRKLLNIVAEGTLPRMPSSTELNAFSEKYAGRPIEHTHTMNWLQYIEPMSLRIVVAANMGHEFLEEVVYGFGYKNQFLAFDQKMYELSNIKEADDVGLGEEYDSFLFWQKSELNSLLENNNMNVGMTELPDGTMIAYFPYDEPTSRYHGNPATVIQYLSSRRNQFIKEYLS